MDRSPVAGEPGGGATSPGSTSAARDRVERLERVAQEVDRFLDLNWGYLDTATREALEPLVRAVEQVSRV